MSTKATVIFFLLAAVELWDQTGRIFFFYKLSGEFIKLTHPTLFLLNWLVYPAILPGFFSREHCQVVIRAEPHLA